MYRIYLRRWHRNRRPGTGFFLLSVMLMALFVFFYFSPSQVNTRQVMVNTVTWLVKKAIQDPRGMVLTSMPALAWHDTPEEMESPGRALLTWLMGVAGIDLNAYGIIRAQIPLLAQVAPAGVPTVTVEPEKSVGQEQPIISHDLSTDTLVGIYNTHTGETYSLTDGTDRLNGKKGGVVTVAEEIAGVLEKEFAIRVARSDTIHDKQYATSYLESEKTARVLVAQNPKMIALLDVHRDAGRSREESLVQVNGRKVAPILIIIGSDARRPFPNWQQNYDFACRVAAKLDELYPGLCQGVRVKEGRYNQFLHPGAILVEVGTANNSLAEAIASGEMLARALGQIINEEIKSKKTVKSKPDQAVDQTVSTLCFNYWK